MMNSKWIRVDLPTVQTNILMIHLDKHRVKVRDFLYRLSSVLETDSVKVSVRATSRDAGCIRFVLYWEISDDDVNATIDKLKIVVDDFNARIL